MTRAARRDATPLRLPAWRSRLLLALLVMCFATLAGRAFYLQGLHNDFLQQKGESRFTRVVEISATRGRIVDRNNEPLAVSTPVESVAASPADVEATARQRARLAHLLGLKRSNLESRLRDTQREFVFLKRQLAPEDAARVVALGVPGIFLQREYRRYYPAGEVTAHLIGFTNVDDRGQEALELAFDDVLAGHSGSRRVIKDRLGEHSGTAGRQHAQIVNRCAHTVPRLSGTEGGRVEARRPGREHRGARCRLRGSAGDRQRALVQSQ